MITPIFIFFPSFSSLVGIFCNIGRKEHTLDKKALSLFTKRVLSRFFEKRVYINSAFVLGKVKKRAFEEERCLSHERSDSFSLACVFVVVVVVRLRFVSFLISLGERERPLEKSIGLILLSS